MTMRMLLPALAAMALLGCARTPAVSTDPAAALGAQLLGTYSNAQQMQALAADVSRTPARSGAWVDAQHARFVAFENPRFGAHPVFFEWRSPDPQGPVTRRRIWVFESVAGRPQMRFFSFADESAFADQSAWQDALRGLDPAAIVNYPAGCTVAFEALSAQRWRGRLNAQTCKITAQRSGKELALGATIEIDANSMRYQEQGLYADGSVAFTVPGVGSYEFVRL